MTSELRDLARRQDGLVAVWQLREREWSRDRVRHAVQGLRKVFDGVYLTGEAAPTRRQRWRAATLTAPGTALAFASAAAAYEIRPHHGRFEVVVRTGTGGPKRFGDLLVCRSTRMEVTT